MFDVVIKLEALLGEGPAAAPALVAAHPTEGSGEVAAVVGSPGGIGRVVVVEEATVGVGAVGSGVVGGESGLFGQWSQLLEGGWEW